MNALEIKNLRKEYKTFTLNDVSFTIPKGYIMGFIGENGAGKTTTLKAMLNIINKETGTVNILGKDLDMHELEIKKEISFMSGEVFYPKRKLKEITSIYKRFYDQWDHQIYKQYITQFKLDENNKIDELSQGMKMKYNISLALSHHAKLLILDEPTSGLDPVVRDNLLEIFQQIVESGDISILFSTHITTDLEKCADYITFIQNGSIIESCSKDELIEKYLLITGDMNLLPKVQSNMIAHKTNAFGFIGLIKTDEYKKIDGIKTGKPSLDDIMIYYAERGDSA